MTIKDLVFDWLDTQPQKHLLAHTPVEMRQKYNDYQTDPQKHLTERNSRRVARQYREEYSLSNPKNTNTQKDLSYTVHNDSYVWDTIEDEATVTHRLDIGIVDQIFLDYNFYGGKLTRNMITEKHGLTNTDWSFLYNSLGLRQKGQLVSPYTLEKADNKEDFLLHTLQMYQKSIPTVDLTQRAANRALTSKLKRQTKKYDEKELREEAMLTHVIESLHDVAFNYTPPFKIKPTYKNSMEDRYALVLPMYDLHIGKEAVEFGSGEKYNLEIARERLITHTQNIVAQASVYNIEEIHTTVGSDQFHIDTETATTTSGTPVGNRETVYETLRYGYELTVDFILNLKSMGVPIVINYVRGNHDAFVGFQMLMFLSGYFKDDPQVTVKVQVDPYVHETYGKNLLAFHHGDGVRKVNLVKLLAQTARKAWGETEHTYAFLGHLHHLEAVDDYGTIIYQVPALCSSDIWHKHKGYNSAKGFMGFLIHREKGLTQTFNQKPTGK